MENKIVIIGGGAAGIFAAISAKTHFPDATVIVLEKTNTLLAKVRISGGGRCNVTHHCFDPKQLTQNYPRGSKELLGPFYQFQPKDTIEWFASHDVILKTEEDGRMFPVTDHSETIINALLKAAYELGVEIKLQQKIEKITKQDDRFVLSFKEHGSFVCDSLIMATGSSTQGHEWAKTLGHHIESPVPSLFTFHVPTSPLKELSGISLQDVRVTLKGTSFAWEGPILITHFGFSGPAILKLSAFAARYLNEQKYMATLVVDWIPNETNLEEIYIQQKILSPGKSLMQTNPFHFPKSFWKTFLDLVLNNPNKTWSELSKEEWKKISEKLKQDEYGINGKTLNKEEFVTCGGVCLKEVNFKTMESKVCKRLYFAGEILDIDGITGGFNFQNAWTTGFIAGSHAL